VTASRTLHPPAPLDADHLRAMLDALAAGDAGLRRAIARIGYPAPRQRDPGFATLLRIILAQQVSTASANAIWRKLEAALAGEITPAGLLALDDAALRSAGFSARKAEYARGLSAAVAAGALEIDRLAQLEEEAAIQMLVDLRGFGRWSAEIYLLFALGRADVFPADDLAVQIALQRLRGLEARPSGKLAREMAENWRPYRGAAAVFLWHLYGSATLDEGRSQAAEESAR
jgi:DNA-3-methyladenine glycosylase II